MRELDKNTNSKEIEQDIVHGVEEEVEISERVQRHFKKWIYFVGVFGVILILPQIIKIYLNQDATSLSLISWGAYLAVATMWCTYGVLNKYKPIITIYAIWMFADILVIYGIFLF